MRYSKAIEVMPSKARFILSLLPLYLHYNNELLPGYQEGEVAYGIDNFVLDSKLQKYLKDITQSKGCIEDDHNRDILALYAMGSTSSIGQGISSDLDIWICVNHTLSQAKIEGLHKKCKFLSTLCKSLGIDLNLFVTLDNRFKEGNADTLDGDNCGSAQNLLLLDEFYRSAFRICGRYISWYLISTAEEKENYNGYLESFYRLPFIKREEWFDFGSVVNSSPAEYFGSGLWLLYKGIDSPFKAALKILLMESYSNDYPNTTLLSSKIKDYMQHNEGYSIKEDAYFLMYKTVSSYLKNRNDFIRLNLVRFCFFSKVKGALTSIKNRPSIYQKRLDIINQIVANWGWDSSEFFQVENKDQWSVFYVKKLNEAIFGSLIKSYKALLSFSIRHGIEYQITSDDAGVLSRKLYAAFDKYPGKIIVLNKEFTVYLQVRALSFIYPSENSLCQKAWYLYPASLTSVSILSTKTAYIGLHISEVVAWALFNNLLTERTEIFVSSKQRLSVTKKKIFALANDLKNILMPHLKPVTEDDLQRPRNLKACCIIVNFEDDVTSSNHIISKYLEHGSSLCCSRQRICLVGSIEIVLINSWGEARTISLPSGEEGVIELLATLLRIYNNQDSGDIKGILSNIRVCSYASEYRDLIRYDLQSLIRQVFSCLQKEDVSSSKISFNVGKNTYIASATLDGKVVINKNNAIFSESSFENQIMSTYGMRPEYALQVPTLVDKYSIIGTIQYFFAKNKGVWDIYVVNERNEVKIYNNYEGSRSALVNAINRFYTRQSDSLESTNFHFNLPQYYVLSQDGKNIHPFTIKMQKEI